MVGLNTRYSSQQYGLSKRAPAPRKRPPRDDSSSDEADDDEERGARLATKLSGLVESTPFHLVLLQGLTHVLICTCYVGVECLHANGLVTELISGGAGASQALQKFLVCATEFLYKALERLAVTFIRRVTTETHWTAYLKAGAAGVAAGEVGAGAREAAKQLFRSIDWRRLLRPLEILMRGMSSSSFGAILATARLFFESDVRKLSAQDVQDIGAASAKVAKAVYDAKDGGAVDASFVVKKATSVFSDHRDALAKVMAIVAGTIAPHSLNIVLDYRAAVQDPSPKSLVLFYTSIVARLVCGSSLADARRARRGKALHRRFLIPRCDALVVALNTPLWAEAVLPVIKKLVRLYKTHKTHACSRASAMKPIEPGDKERLSSFYNLLGAALGRNDLSSA